MSKLKVDAITNVLETGSVEFPLGATTSGMPFITLDQLGPLDSTSFTATAGQYLFTVSEYSNNTGTAVVIVNNRVLGSSEFTEPSSTTFALVVPAMVGDVVIFKSKPLPGSSTAPGYETPPSSSNTPGTVVTRNASGNFSAGIITATLNGNATTATTATNATNATNATLAANATKLATARTIALSGDVTGSTSFDGSANATITAVVVDNSHNHTSNTGNYTCTGNFTATGNVTAYSDSRLKDDVRIIEDALNKIKTLRGVTYTRNDIEGAERQTGVIAQEVQVVLPEAIDTSGEYLSVAYGNMIGLLIESIKELSAKVEALEMRNDD